MITCNHLQTALYTVLVKHCSWCYDRIYLLFPSIVTWTSGLPCTYYARSFA